MSISNEDYEKAQEVVAEKEREILNNTSTEIAALVVAVTTALKNLIDLKNSLPSTVGVTGPGSSNLSSAISQVQNSSNQLNYVTTSIASSLAQYPTVDAQAS